MIQEILNKKNLPAITSDHWHVVRARWSGDASGRPSFVRSIVSEHEDCGAATAAAEQILTSLGETMNEREPDARDQVFVRRPDFKSLKTAKRVSKRRK